MNITKGADVLLLNCLLQFPYFFERKCPLYTDGWFGKINHIVYKIWFIILSGVYILILYIVLFWNILDTQDDKQNHVTFDSLSFLSLTYQVRPEAYLFVYAMEKDASTGPVLLYKLLPGQRGGGGGPHLFLMRVEPEPFSEGPVRPL